MNPPAGQNIYSLEKCPLCGERNGCQLVSPDAYKGQCRCLPLEIPDALLAQVPLDARNQACVMEIRRLKKAGASQTKCSSGDFYFENGLMVFTAAYHRRRGYCCESGCRHCPYPKEMSSARL